MVCEKFADNVLAVCCVVRYDEHFGWSSQRIDTAPSEYLPLRLGRPGATASDDLPDTPDRICSNRRRCDGRGPAYGVKLAYAAECAGEEQLRRKAGGIR